MTVTTAAVRRRTPRTISDMQEKPTRADHLARLEATDEVSVEGLRVLSADVINRALRGRITFVTSRGRRVGGFVPVEAAEVLATEAGQTAPQA